MMNGGESHDHSDVEPRPFDGDVVFPTSPPYADAIPAPPGEISPTAGEPSSPYGTYPYGPNVDYGGHGYGAQHPPGPYGPYGHPPGVYGPYAYPYSAGYAPRNNGKAIASMVMGIASIVICPVVALPGLIMGYQARREIGERQGYETGGGMALAGLITGWIGVALLVLRVVMFAVFAASEFLPLDY